MATKTELKAARSDAAHQRFFLYTVAIHKKWRFLVCDGNNQDGDKTIGKFRTREDADAFRQVRIQRYIETGT